MKRRMEARLLEWKNREKRMPLLVHGARQVGKTYTLSEFGEKHFRNTVYVDFETNLSVANFIADDITPARLIPFLEASVGEEITPGETLIIFDEIQACERALTSLKYFCDLAPEYHVAAAGSLLGVAIKRERFSFPVGKVEEVTLGPLDFEEFLLAVGEERLAGEIRVCFGNNEAMPEPLHKKAIELYRAYLVIGGMPACVNSFAGNRKFVLMPTIQNSIVNNYVADMAKYAEPSDTVKIRACYNSVHTQLAKENRKFQYKVVQRGGSASLFGVSIEWLVFAGIVLKCRKIDHAYNPIPVYEDLSSFKLYMSDVGLLAMKSGLPQQTVLSGETNLFMGSVAENYVAGALSANGYPLFYWTSEHTAELDFVIQKETEIIGIEVKKGVNTRSKSLGVFAAKYSPAYSIRISEKNFGFENNIKSVPLYAVFCI